MVEEDKKEAQAKNEREKTEMIAPTTLNPVLAPLLFYPNQL